MQFIWQLDPCELPPFAPPNVFPPPPPGTCPGPCNGGGFGPGPLGPGGGPGGGPGAGPGLLPPPGTLPKPWVPGTDYGPSKPTAPNNGSHFEEQLRKFETVERIEIGPPVEVVQPWRWAVTFLHTNWNMSLSNGQGPQFLMQNVTAFAAGSFATGEPLVRRAVALAHSRPPFACIDHASTGTRQCEATGSNYLQRNQGRTVPVLSPDERAAMSEADSRGGGGGTALVAWLPATLSAIAVVIARVHRLPRMHSTLCWQ